MRRILGAKVGENGGFESSEKSSKVHKDLQINIFINIYAKIVQSAPKSKAILKTTQSRAQLLRARKGFLKRDIPIAVMVKW